MSLSLSLDFSFLNEDLVNGIINSVKPVFGGNDTRWFKCEKTKKNAHMNGNKSINSAFSSEITDRNLL